MVKGLAGPRERGPSGWRVNSKEERAEDVGGFILYKIFSFLKGNMKNLLKFTRIF